NFGWQQQSATFNDQGTWLQDVFLPPAWKPGDNPRSLADVNGDGKLDLVGFRLDAQVSLATGTGFAAPTRWSPDYGIGWTARTPRVLADVNGDGLADVVGFGRSGMLVEVSTGTGFDKNGWSQAPYTYFTIAGGWTSAGYARMLVDVDGDGLADI